MFLSGLFGVLSNYYVVYRKAHEADFNFKGYLLGAADYTMLSVGSLIISVSSAISSGAIVVGTPGGCLQVFILAHFIDSWTNKAPTKVAAG